MKITRRQLRYLIKEVKGKAIRKTILENRQQQRFESLLPLLDSNDLETVKQAIEMCTGVGLAKLIKHTVKRGKNRGGRVGAIHVFVLKPEKSFLEFFRRVFEENGGSSPNGQIIDSAAGFTFKNLGKQEIQIFAEDALKTWRDFSDEWYDETVTEVELPV